MTKWVEHGNGICWEESTLLADAGLRHGVTGKSGGALWAFAGCLLLSSLLVVALPAKVVNR